VVLTHRAVRPRARGCPPTRHRRNPRWTEVLIDATIRDPAASAHATDEYTATAQKRQRYQQMANECRATFIPFYLDIYGAWGREAVRFMKDIQLLHLNLAPAGDQSAVVNYRLYMHRIAIAVQVGNAQAAMACNQAAIDKLIRLASRNVRP